MVQALLFGLMAVIAIVAIPFAIAAFFWEMLTGGELSYGEVQA
jgi:uncharacterized membrane protein YccF (DUF307 family)